MLQLEIIADSAMKEDFTFLWMTFRGIMRQKNSGPRMMKFGIDGKMKCGESQTVKRF